MRLPCPVIVSVVAVPKALPLPASLVVVSQTQLTVEPLPVQVPPVEPAAIQPLVQDAVLEGLQLVWACAAVKLKARRVVKAADVSSLRMTGLLTHTRAPVCLVLNCFYHAGRTTGLDSKEEGFALRGNLVRGAFPPHRDCAYL